MPALSKNGKSPRREQRGRILPACFFRRDTLRVAEEMLGKYLVRRNRAEEIRLLITEVEAYDGPHDRASHASRGLTPRTRVMFGAPGVFYVYFTYGMHWLLNVVTGPQGYPAAVLIRGGIAAGSDGRIALNGPARLTKYLHVDGALNCRRASRATGLWFEDGGISVPACEIVAGKRIGVDYAGEWKDKPYNLRLKDAASLAELPPLIPGARRLASPQ